MIRSTLFLLLFLLSGTHVLGQTPETKPSIENKKSKPEIISNKKEVVLTQIYQLDPSKLQLKIKPIEDQNYEEQVLNDSITLLQYLKDLEKIKYESRRSSIQKPQNSTETLSKTSVVMDTIDSAPPDNTMAISDKGFIVAADNSQIGFYTQDGSVVNELSYGNFFNFLTEEEIKNTADPRVIFDSDNERFIFFLQTGGNSLVSQCLLAFSESEDPNLGWHAYKFNDFQDGDEVWFDYPSLSVNGNEVFLSGNLFTNDDNFKGNVFFQFNKEDGYAGDNMHGKRWRDIVPSWNFEPAPSLYAVPCGHAGQYGPGTYIINTQSSGGSNVFLYDLTDNLDDNPELKKYTIDIGDYEKSGSAAQKGTSIRLDAGDCRVTGGFYMQGNIFFVFSKDNGKHFSGVSFVRINLSELTVKCKFFHDKQNSDYCYPSIAHRGENINDMRTVIVYLRSGSNDFPSFRQRLFKENMHSSGNSTTIRLGANFVDYGGSLSPATTIVVFGAVTQIPQKERWGDYITAQRRYANNEVWVAGHTGSAINKWRSHLIKLEF